jgi:hemerythrin-like metal-binding protein
MAVFFWSNKLSVGNDFIDADHQHWIDLLNQLHTEMNAGKGPEVLGPVLDELVAYTGEHFGREEDVMRQIGFAGYAEHKQAHDDLTREVRELQAKFRAGETRISVTVLKFLFDWLFQHIMTVDKKLAAVIREAA